jgi:hypothetical protein
MFQDSRPSPLRPRLLPRPRFSPLSVVLKLFRLASLSNYDSSGEFHSVEITPERTEGLLGPYNRRNVYGAVLAYGPVMRSDPRTRPMFDSVSQFALCGRAPLLRELAIDPQTISRNLHVRLQTRPGLPTSDLQLQFEAPCK